MMTEAEDDGFTTIHPEVDDGRSPSGRATAAEPVVSALRDGIPNALEVGDTDAELLRAINWQAQYGDEHIFLHECALEEHWSKRGNVSIKVSLPHEYFEIFAWLEFSGEEFDWDICDLHGALFPLISDARFSVACKLVDGELMARVSDILPAQGMEAEGGDSEAGSVHDSPVPAGNAPQDIIQFQAGREAAISGQKRDARRSRDWLAGYDQEAG